MLTNRPKTKILVDGGDPNETLRIKSLIGFVDGQTTNPSLIAKKARDSAAHCLRPYLAARRREKRIQEYCSKHFTTGGKCWSFH